METAIADHLSSGRYEEVLADADRLLAESPQNLTALHLKARALYHLGEHEPCIRLLEAAIHDPSVAKESLEKRIRLGSLLAKALLQQGRYGEVRDLVDRAVPPGATPVEEYGEMLLAGAWAAFFDEKPDEANERTTRVFENATEHFTCGRAALCCALSSRRAGEAHRGVAYLVKAHHHLSQAENVFGNPPPVRTLYLAQLEIARHQNGALLDQVEREAAALPPASKMAALVRETVDLYRRFLAKEMISSVVLEAVRRGVKRPWVAFLPGSHLPLRPAEPREIEEVAAGVEPSPEDALREKLAKLRLRTADDVTRIRTRKAPAGTILHVEPDDRSAAAFQECIRDSVFSVVAHVPTVQRALDEYVTRRPALVVLDLLAPGAVIQGPEGATGSVHRFLEIDPHAKIVVTYSREQKFLFMGAIRAGARANIGKPYDKSHVLGSLHKAMTARSGVEALRVATLELRKPIACSLRPVQGGVIGLLSGWEHFIARSIDPMGLEGNLDREMRAGEVVRLNLELPGTARTLQTMAEAASAKWDPVRHLCAVRFNYIKLSPEARDELVRFITETLARGNAPAK